ncbi:MAG: HEAT repeat domain-containing protein, partial [Deltaproteobacteria bacterium]|nr:HEAT repeat domain-containing protein [Deltaproteobacteria bacterium]
EDARQALLAALGDKDKDLATIAAGALGNLGMTDQVKGALLAASRDNPQVTMQVMHQLLQAGAPEGLRLAEDMLNGKDTNGANSAVWALANLGTPESRRLLDRALTSSDQSVRLAAISSLASNPDDASTDTLLRLTRDSDSGVRTQALQTLGQLGSEKAQLAIIEASRNGKTEERIAAINGLASMDDVRASQQLATLMRDPDPQVAQTAIQSAYNGGAEVDQALTRIVNDAGATPELKQQAAAQLRGRGSDLDDATEQAVTALAGARQDFGGYGYGGYGYGGYMEGHDH